MKTAADTAMKHAYHTALRCLTALLALAPMAASAQMVIATDGNPPAFPAQAILEMRSTTSGLLVPRMTNLQRNAIGGGTPPNGLIVFVTTVGEVGYWYYDAVTPAWLPLVSGVGWNVPGNNGVLAADFVGTTSAQPFVFRTNNVERMRINANGRVGIGTAAAPPENVDVVGAMRISGNTLTNTAGNIRWNAASSAHDGNIDGTANGWYQLENTLIERPVAPYQVIVPPACLPSVRTFDLPSGGVTTSTIETPYSTLWESSRKQYVWRAAELAAAQICPDEPWTSATFNTSQAGVQALQEAEMKMKNTTSDVTATIEVGGWTLVWSNPLFTPGAAGWNSPHNFSPGAFSWNGSANVKMDFCYDNFNWTGSTGVVTMNTPGLVSTYGIFCDACGGGAVPCGPYPAGHPQCQGAPCLGWGSVFGCNLLPTTNLASCDGDPTTWVGGQGSAFRRPQVRFGVTSGTIVPPAIVNDRYLWSDKALMLGTAAWAASGGMPLFAFKGPGTITAQFGVYSGGTYLNDHIFDMYYDGEARPEDAERVAGYRRMGINEMVNYVERERHLPTIPGREEWNATGPFSADKLTNHLWVTVEEQALYIKELNERLELMEQYLIKKRLRELERQAAGKR